MEPAHAYDLVMPKCLCRARTHKGREYGVGGLYSPLGALSYVLRKDSRRVGAQPRGAGVPHSPQPRTAHSPVALSAAAGTSISRQNPARMA
ncbi:hypothetical protein GCM10010260_10080 [Streptomyces filipinensis]|uniref:Uncharacterized protein n=1 Tax=Streptomyces filipinensis TaxID=66887 RepID=A0A918I6W1_9ACTN|nr:hypothetical protein GCM10010260_10080 [Streptomyces filipinensis]